MINNYLNIQRTVTFGRLKGGSGSQIFLKLFRTKTSFPQSPGKRERFGGRERRGNLVKKNLLIL